MVFSQFFLHDVAKKITLVDMDSTALNRAKKDKFKFLNIQNSTLLNQYFNENIEDVQKKNR